MELMSPGKRMLILRSLSKKGEEEGQKKADDDASHEREIEGEFVPLDVDIAGEPADPGDLIAQDQDQPQDHEEYTTDDQDLAQITEGRHNTTILPRIFHVPHRFYKNMNDGPAPQYDFSDNGVP